MCCDIFLQGYLLKEGTLGSTFAEQSFRSEHVSDFIKMKICKYFKSSVVVILQFVSRISERRLNNLALVRLPFWFWRHTKCNIKESVACRSGGKLCLHFAYAL